jgi:hypothetical protein
MLFVEHAFFLYDICVLCIILIIPTKFGGKDGIASPVLTKAHAGHI